MKTHRLISSLLIGVAAAAAPALSQPHFGANDASNEIVAVFVADVAGDGVELAASVTSPLLGREARPLRWLAAGSADSFLVRRSGMLSTVGRPSQGAGAAGADEEWRLVRGDGSGRKPGRRPAASAAAQAGTGSVAPPREWSALAGLDLDGNGRLTAEDPEFHTLALFSDADANGAVDAGELVSLEALGVVAVILPADVESAGALERGDGTSTPLVRVTLTE